MAKMQGVELEQSESSQHDRAELRDTRILTTLSVKGQLHR